MQEDAQHRLLQDLELASQLCFGGARMMMMMMIMIMIMVMVMVMSVVVTVMLMEKARFRSVGKRVCCGAN